MVITGIRVVAVLLLLTPGALFAQQKKLTSEGLAVDVVSLKSGKSLRGIVVTQPPKGDLTILVQRDWLAHANPSLASTVLKENLENQQLAWKQTHDRISEYLKKPSLGPHVRFFFEQERDRLSKLIADQSPPVPDFVFVGVRPQTISKVQPAASDRQRIAMFAWSNQLKNVESQDVALLRKQLKELSVDLDGPVPELADRIAARSQDEAEWSARVALIEYTLSKPLDFQGMGDTIVRTEQGKPVDLGAVLPKLIQQQLSSVLSELTLEANPVKKAKYDPRWWGSAVPVAEQEPVSGFRITRLEQVPNSPNMTVETAFVASLPKGNWQVIWSVRETADVSRERPQAEAQIQQDPQLKSAIQMVESLGLGKESLTLAIRAGAATMHAQREADGAFAEFRSRYTQRLDGPPLSIGARLP